MGQLERLQVRSPQWFLDRLLDETHVTVSRIHILLMSSKSSICYSPSHFPSLVKSSTWFSAPLQCVQTCIYFPQWCVLPLETCISTKAFWFMGNWMRQCSAGAPGPWPRGLETIHGPLLGLQLGPRSICLLPDAQGGGTPPSFFGIWYWIYSSHKSTWSMDECQIVVNGGHDEEYLIQPCSWHHPCGHLFTFLLDC